jgi:site-specific recombinase XerD
VKQKKEAEMSPGCISLDSECPPIRSGHLPAVPCRISQTALHQAENREYLDKQINLFRQSELPGKEHAEQYLSHLYRKNCRSGTIESNQISIRLFLRFIQDRQGIIHLAQVTRRSIEAFVEYEQDRGLKPMTVSGRLISIHAFLRFLVEGEVIDPNVLRKKIRIKVPEALPKAIEPENIKVLFAVGELLDLKIPEVNLKEKKVIIYEAQKTRVGRVVYFSDDAKEALGSWLKARDPKKEFVFYGQGRNRLGYTGAQLRFEKYNEAAGLSAKGYTIHCLRHTFASELLNAGMRLECLQPLLGHTSLEVTRRYARLTDRTREEEYFRAMAIIEKGAAGGHYRFDH